METETLTSQVVKTGNIVGVLSSLFCCIIIVIVTISVTEWRSCIWEPNHKLFAFQSTFSLLIKDRDILNIEMCVTETSSLQAVSCIGFVISR